MSSCKPVNTQISLSPSKLAMIYIDLYSNSTRYTQIISASTGEYLVFLGTTPISQKSRNQRIVAYFFIEGEYKALIDGTAEIL